MRKTKKNTEKISVPYRRRVRATVPQRCFFCERKTEPLAMEFKILEPFLTRRGKIRGRKRSGLCAKHQRWLAREIKEARNLGLLPFRILG
ncbi:30S ribosomal protein S18 [candidate division WWE3 bacterium CG09_land_8_20_14_0_10_47_33]|uniref:30S ribosomal protein S18 n=1 Tax=candidate division WWE3 bacterium CG_4_9_14_0_2_um_filter_48_10 TaxID=1975078 RepID=A0A2M8EIU2_UNCKA|nr:MAG: 30S ribosomal protein S18 [candidate division WWE3 bacterium CG09_land_8_20_14_0_10_47_33]PIZ41393.1 MAG: 30S ribosomal protein S18 [candidate division WWE3 bacterium CG_4_10_14_0_2_um_filter_47_8]PJC22669.1 MAG: 30S ribosomal protein S18 [candidate division WWE3 bacterium CG_4_9_14_0_2_um_filter_48_10]PJE51841.1 MAG: 30S ribosomal protein S18 [candidate division WWE3 bacterium CG10_big_fil_rev_8_21_14_0_10_48_23]